jgi:hypothetical protein
LRALPLQNLAHCWIANGRAGFFSDFFLPAHRIYSYGSHLISVSSRHCPHFFVVHVILDLIVIISLGRTMWHY